MYLNYDYELIHICFNLTDTKIDLDLDYDDVKPYLDTQGNMIQFVDGSRGKRQLVINSHYFTRMSLCGKVSYWR